MLIAAAFTDLKWRTIPNALTLGATAIAFFISVFAAGWHGVLFCGLGWTIGFVPFYVLFRLGGLGGGDVKLMGAVGALGGPKLVIMSFWYTSLIGFLMAIAVLVRNHKIEWGVRQTKRLLASLAGRASRPQIKEPGALTIPYGLAIVFGSYLAFFTSL